MKGKGKKKSNANEVEVNGIEHPQSPPPKLYKDFYEVEAIRRKRLHKGKIQYLIKWLGWPERTNTWEPLENLQTVLDLVDDFETRLKSGICQNRKRKHDNPSQPAPPSIANPHIVKFADEGDTNADATSHASPDDKAY